MFKKKKKIEEKKKEKRYLLRLVFSDISIKFVYFDENKRHKTFNRINEAILHNKQINLTDDMNKTEHLVLKPREILFIERDVYEE